MVEPTDLGEGGVDMAFLCEVDSDVAYDVVGEMASEVDDDVTDEVAKVCIGGKGGLGEWSPICQVVTNE